MKKIIVSVLLVLLLSSCLTTSINTMYFGVDEETADTSQLVTLNVAGALVLDMINGEDIKGAADVVYLEAGEHVIQAHYYVYTGNGYTYSDKIDVEFTGEAGKAYRLGYITQGSLGTGIDLYIEPVEIAEDYYNVDYKRMGSVSYFPYSAAVGPKLYGDYVYFFTGTAVAQFDPSKERNDRTTTESVFESDIYHASWLGNEMTAFVIDWNKKLHRYNHETKDVTYIGSFENEEILDIKTTSNSAVIKTSKGDEINFYRTVGNEVKKIDVFHPNTQIATSNTNSAFALYNDSIISIYKDDSEVIEFDLFGISNVAIHPNEPVLVAGLGNRMLNLFDYDISDVYRNRKIDFSDADNLIVDLVRHPLGSGKSFFDYNGDSLFNYTGSMSFTFHEVDYKSDIRRLGLGRYSLGVFHLPLILPNGSDKFVEDLQFNEDGSKALLVFSESNVFPPKGPLTSFSIYDTSVEKDS